MGEQREGLWKAHRGTGKGPAPHIPPSLVKDFFFFFFLLKGPKKCSWV